MGKRKEKSNLKTGEDGKMAEADVLFEADDAWSGVEMRVRGIGLQN